jgi:hypothetical protein
VGHDVCVPLATSWFTSDHFLVLANVILAVVALGSIYFSIQVMRGAEGQLNAARKQLEQDRLAQEASIRPLIVREPFPSDDSPGHEEEKSGTTPAGKILIRLRVRNVGTGPALLVRNFLTDLVLHSAPTPESYVIESGGSYFVSCLVLVDDPNYQALSDAMSKDEMYFVVCYSDIAVRQRLLTTLAADTSASLTNTVGETWLCDADWNQVGDPIVSGKN